MLYVTVLEDFTDADVDAYIRFHNAFVLHRVKKGWPHRFGLVYDARRVRPPSNLVAYAERMMAFALMHSSLGETYKRWLHRVVAILPDSNLTEWLLQVQAPFKDASTKPVGVLTAGDSVAAAMLA